MADLEVVATASDPEANSYLSLDEADWYVEALPGADAWDELEEEQKAAILIQGTRLIDAYKAWGTRKLSTQRLAFPRGQDKEGVVPEDVRLALAAFADFMASQDLSPLKALQGEGVTSASILGQAMTFERDPSGLPAPARTLLERVFGRTAGWGAPKASRSNCFFG